MHIAIDVPAGGENYSVSFLGAADEDMRVVGVRRFKSKGIESDVISGIEAGWR